MCDGPRRTRWDGSRDAGSEHEYGRAPGEIQTDDRTHSFQTYTRPPVATVESADHRSRRAAPRRAAIPPPRGPHLPVCASMCVPCKLVIGVRVRRRSGGLESGASKFCLVAVLVMLLSAASASVWWRRIEAGTLRLGSEPQLESHEASTCGVATWCISHGASIGWRGFGRPVAPPPPLLSSRLERLATLHFFSSAAAFLANLLEGLSRGAIRGAITLTAARPTKRQEALLRLSAARPQLTSGDLIVSSFGSRQKSGGVQRSPRIQPPGLVRRSCPAHDLTMGEAALPLSPRLSARRSSSPRPGTTGSVWRNIHESTAVLSPRAAATPRREDESVILAAKATAASNSVKSMAAHRDMLSARRRTRCFVNMARESTRPQINRPYSDAHPDTNYSPRCVSRHASSSTIISTRLARPRRGFATWFGARNDGVSELKSSTREFTNSTERPCRRVLAPAASTISLRGRRMSTSRTSTSARHRASASRRRARPARTGSSRRAARCSTSTPRAAARTASRPRSTGKAHTSITTTFRLVGHLRGSVARGPPVSSLSARSPPPSPPPPPFAPRRRMTISNSKFRTPSERGTSTSALRITIYLTSTTLVAPSIEAPPASCLTKHVPSLLSLLRGVGGGVARSSCVAVALDTSGRTTDDRRRRYVYGVGSSSTLEAQGELHSVVSSFLAGLAHP